MSAKRKNRAQPKQQSAQAVLQALIATMTPEQLRALTHAAFPSVVDQPLPDELIKSLGEGKLAGIAKANGEAHAKKAREKLLREAGLLKKSDSARDKALARSVNRSHGLPRARAAQWKPIVIETLRSLPFYAVAAKAAGISREHLSRYCAKHPDFEAQCKRAMDFAAEAGAAKLWARAFGGSTEPIWSRDAKGNPIKVDEKKIFDNKAAIFMLQTHLRDKYFLKQVQEITGPGGSAIPMIAPTQVQIIIPDNGRDKPAVAVSSEVKQIEPPPTAEQQAQYEREREALHKQLNK